MTAYNIKKLINANSDQFDRSIRIVKTIDFTKRTLAQADTCTFFTIPKGFVLLDRAFILITAEGGTCTVDVGISGSTDGMLDGGNLNGTANTAIAAGTNGAGLIGKVFTSDTDVVLTANNAVAAAKVVVMLYGYMMPT
jgi:hypothetical protein